VVARQGTNRLIEERIVTPLRQSFGNNVSFKPRALPRIAKALKLGEHAGLLIDIKINPRVGVPVTFFGHKTYAVKSSAYLQIKLGIPVLPVTMVRTDKRKYKLITGDPIPWSDNGKPVDQQIAELTQLHQAALEKLIRAYPEQWLWMHDRWKKILDS
jgi:KDO2-lipid IV(A) lauroyltransferase